MNESLIKNWKRFRMNEQIKSDPTHPNHYIQNGLSVWDVIKAYTEDLNGSGRL